MTCVQNFILMCLQECRRNGVECIVAPYEADAQLTYLQKEGIVDFVITEDSDMLVFGCKRVGKQTSSMKDSSWLTGVGNRPL